MPTSKAGERGGEGKGGKTAKGGKERGGEGEGSPLRNSWLRACWELLNGQRFPGGPKLHYMNHTRRILSKSNIPISDLEKLAKDRYSWKMSVPAI